MQKLIICVAPVGMWGKGDNNPLTPQQVAGETYKCYLEGASMVHLHVRDFQGNQTGNLEAFCETVNLIKEKCDIIIQGSTGGISSLCVQERCVALDVPGVEVATLNMGSVNFFDGVYINSPSDIAYWAKRMRDKGIKPELCTFEAGMIQNALQLVKKGLINGKLYFNFSLGFPGAMPATLKNLVLLMDTIPADSNWLYVEHGAKNFNSIALAMSAGGHVRVGFEDSIYLDSDSKAESNAELVKKAARIAKEIGRKVANPSEAREILGVG